MEDEVSSSSSSSSHPRPLLLHFHERFQDIPEAIRWKMIEAMVEVMRQSLKDTADGIRCLSLDDRHELIVRLMLEIEAAELMGLEVDEYKKMLQQLLSRLSTWDKIRVWAAERRGRMKRLWEDDRVSEGRRYICSDFRWPASLPWNCQEEEEEKALEIYD